MNWVTDPDRVKVQWRLIYLNLAAVIMNLGLAIWLWRWMSLANLISAAFSGYITYGLWKKLPEITAKQKQKIIDYMRGDTKFRYHDG